MGLISRVSSRTYREENFKSLQKNHQRNGRKTLTTVQGIEPKFDLKKLVKACKKEFACNGTVVEHKEYGEVMQFQGDQREHIRSFLLKIQLCEEDNLKTHGF